MSENPLDQITIITQEDIDIFVKKFEDGCFDPKILPCFRCGKEDFYNYGVHLNECDECYFKRFPKDQVEIFYRSFFE